VAKPAPEHVKQAEKKATVKKEETIPAKTEPVEKQERQVKSKGNNYILRNEK